VAAEKGDKGEISRAGGRARARAHTHTQTHTHAHTQISYDAFDPEAAEGQQRFTYVHSCKEEYVLLYDQ
jgi:hypothetical protein